MLWRWSASKLFIRIDPDGGLMRPFDKRVLDSMTRWYGVPKELDDILKKTVSDKLKEVEDERARATRSWATKGRRKKRV